LRALIKAKVQNYLFSALDVSRISLFGTNAGVKKPTTHASFEEARATIAAVDAVVLAVRFVATHAAGNRNWQAATFHLQKFWVLLGSSG
jgi:hypothetical protein